jgi:integrase
MKVAKRVLCLPDLDFAKRAVLNTLCSSDSKRAYGFAIDHFGAWYCSEPRLAFSKTVVLRYRLELEARRLAPATINLRLAAVRRLAFEAADTGLLNPDLAAGIARVKGAKRIGGWMASATHITTWMSCRARWNKTPHTNKLGSTATATGALAQQRCAICGSSGV